MTAAIIISSILVAYVLYKLHDAQTCISAYQHSNDCCYLEDEEDTEFTWLEIGIMLIDAVIIAFFFLPIAIIKSLFQLK